MVQVYQQITAGILLGFGLYELTDNGLGSILVALGFHFFMGYMYQPRNRL